MTPVLKYFYSKLATWIKKNYRFTFIILSILGSVIVYLINENFLGNINIEENLLNFLQILFPIIILWALFGPSLIRNENTYIIKGDEKMDVGKFSEALIYYEKAFSLNPVDYIYARIANAKTSLNDFKGAINICKEGIKVNPNNSNLFHLCGVAQSHLGAFKEASKSYSKAIDLNSNEQEVYTYSAELKTSLGDHIGAIEDLNKAIRRCKIKPYGESWEIFTVYCARGKAKQAANDFEGAIKDFDKSIEVADTEIVAYVFNHRGFLKAKMEDFEGAIKDFDKGIWNLMQLKGKRNISYSLDAVKKMESDLYCNRADVKKKLGANQEALSDYDNAIQTCPTYVKAFNNRGLLKAKMEDFEGAIKDYTRAIQIDPELVQSYNNRGRLNIKLELMQEGVNDFYKVIELSPNAPQGYRGIGDAKKRLGDLKGACENWEKASKLGDQDASKFFKEQCQ